jgi:putative copper export protein
VLLSIAALNKVRLTPLLARDYAEGAARLRTSIRVEIAVALLVLCASAWLVATAPDS